MSYITDPSWTLVYKYTNSQTGNAETAIYSRK